MKIKLPKSLAWRYELYLSEYVDLYGSFPFYLKQKIKNLYFTYVNIPEIVYVYANKRNVGDYISHRGVKKIINIDGPSLFCTPIYKKRFESHLRKLKNRNPNIKLVIGGGGLLQSVFKDFWEYIIASELDYCIYGIGINKMQGRLQLHDSLLKQIIKGAFYSVVRDNVSYLSLFQNAPSEIQKLSICPSVNFFHQEYWQLSPQRNNLLLHVVHPSDLRLANANHATISKNLKEIAQELGLEYKETTNMSSNYKRSLKYINISNVVVSSRLHGCIMAYGMGIPFIALYCDYKTESFVTTHTAGKGVNAIEAEDKTRLLKIIALARDEFDNDYEAVKRKIKENSLLGAVICKKIQSSK
jgi:polysaccharide pyruvyl transferase WcaK-like protein